MFIVTDGDENFSSGKTLEEAFETYKNYHDEYVDPQNLIWYEATEIKVERKVSYNVIKPEAPKVATKAPAKTEAKK